MRFLWYFSAVAVFLAVVHNVRSEEEPAAVASFAAETVELAAVPAVAADTVELAAVPAVAPEAEIATLIELDAGVKDQGELNRETRQFGFGRPYYGGGYYRPRPYYGGGFYRPRPYYGFNRPSLYGGGFYG